jgi:chemotaxis signal transduction protein
VERVRDVIKVSEEELLDYPDVGAAGYQRYISKIVSLDGKISRYSI